MRSVIAIVMALSNFEESSKRNKGSFAFQYEIWCLQRTCLLLWRPCANIMFYYFICSFFQCKILVWSYVYKIYLWQSTFSIITLNYLSCLLTQFKARILLFHLIGDCNINLLITLMAREAVYWHSLVFTRLCTLALAALNLYAVVI